MEGRQVAKKVKLSDLANGKYVKVEGEWEPNYVDTPTNQKVSRANVVAVVATEPVPGDFNSFIIDDGSARLPVRAFGDTEVEVDLGDVVLIVGRPRLFSEQIYLVPEIVKKVQNKKWIEYRKLELGEIPTQEVILEEPMTDSPVDTMIEVIRGLDSGNGADTEEVIARSKIENADDIISSLMREGEIFEITSGKIKVLD